MPGRLRVRSANALHFNRVLTPMSASTLRRMSREETLAHIATHGGYHRGAVGRIMAQASVAVPRDIFTVHLHQSEPERREA